MRKKENRKRNADRERTYGCRFIAFFLVIVCLYGCGRQTDLQVTGFTGISPDTAGLGLQETESPGISSAAVKETAGGTDVDDPQDRQSALPADAVKEGVVSSMSDGAVSSAVSSDTLTVYVRGAVRTPGVYQLGPGARIYQVIEAAGGFSADADQEWLNQAKLLSDGEMVTVYTIEETSERRAEGADGIDSGAGDQMSGAAGSASDGTSGSQGGEHPVNLNTASREELMSLPGIGEAKAEAIIRYREENGPFASAEDVMNISGIKTAVFSKIRDKVTV